MDLSFVYILEMLGTAAFAVSGALAASRKNMDIFGFCVLALMPAVGGGTVRDIIIDRVPVFWISDNRYVAVAIIAALIVFFTSYRPGSRRRILVWMDALGLALFAALGTENLMRTAYRSFVSDHSARWAVMLRRLAQPESLPALVHCTAGKDRTGFAVALVLLSVGVPEETVFEDYLMTNRYRAAFQRFVLRWVPLYSLFRTEPEDLLPLLEARREYLQTSLDAIDELHGSLDAYLTHELCVTAEIRAALHANLLR